jgi:hypothetical protein
MIIQTLILFIFEKKKVESVRKVENYGVLPYVKICILKTKTHIIVGNQWFDGTGVGQHKNSLAPFADDGGIPQFCA